MTTDFKTAATAKSLPVLAGDACIVGRLLKRPPGRGARLATIGGPTLARDVAQGYDGPSRPPPVRATDAPHPDLDLDARPPARRILT